MSLQEEIENIKAQLAEQENRPEEELQEAPVPEEEEIAEGEKEEEPEEKKAEEEKKEEPLKENKEELDNAGYARLRREAAAEKKRAEALQRELEDLRRAKEKPLEEQQQEQAALPPQLRSLIERDQFHQAEQEFSVYESKVKQQNPEYAAVAAEYAQALYQSFKVQNPRKSDIELSDMTKRSILMRAAEFARAGYDNPVEELYYEAKGLGFTGKSLQKEVPEAKEEKLQPDLRKLAENRKRSAGMAANNGRSQGLMTQAAAADLSVGEWAKLPAAEKRRIMYGA